MGLISERFLVKYNNDNNNSCSHYMFTTLIGWQDTFVELAEPLNVFSKKQKGGKIHQENQIPFVYGVV